MAWASTYTSLSLDRYAQIMGISPVHFQGASGSSIFPLSSNRNNDLWTQYSWQDADRVSREDLARTIDEAEGEIADLLGFFPGPRWVSQEVHDFPRFYRPDLHRRGGRDVRDMRIGISTGRGKVISPGIRGVSLVGTATVAGGTLVYSDEDGDGYSETATITLPTSLTNVAEIKPYFAGQSGDQEWEIRPVRSISVSSNVLTIVLWSWQLIDPSLQTAFPTGLDWTGLDIANSIYVSSVDVYREYTDITCPSAVFYWESTLPGSNVFCTICGGSGCSVCSLTTQDGCSHIRDAVHGVLVPTPGTYSADDGVWVHDSFTVFRDPDMVKLYYYSGHLSERWLRGVDADPLEYRLANAIAWLATARLERPWCSGTNATALSVGLMEDLAFSGRDGSHILSERDLDNPFGTRRGEIRAYRALTRLSGTVSRRMRGVAA